jgi:hypothetical protein
MPIDHPSHFSMVGFEVATKDAAAMQQSFDPLLQKCEFAPIGGDDTLCIVRDPSGSELLIGLKEKGASYTFVTANPAFAGEGKTAVEIDATVPNKEAAYAKYEIRISARFAGEKTPLIFELADPRQAASFKPGSKLDIDIAAFSYDAELYADAAAYDRAQAKPNVKVRFAPDYFIPSGMFNEGAGGAGGADGPDSYADFSGTVLKSALRSNAVGGAKFWWALVKTYGGATIDVVLDPATVPNEIKPGSILTGRFWLSARLAAKS